MGITISQYKQINPKLYIPKIGVTAPKTGKTNKEMPNIFRYKVKFSLYFLKMNNTSKK